jgi:hypothetical protein
MLVKRFQLQYLVSLYFIVHQYPLTSLAYYSDDSDWNLSNRPDLQDGIWNSRGGSIETNEESSSYSSSSSWSTVSSFGFKSNVIQQQQQHPYYPTMQPFTMNLNHIALSLRYTCEMNRRLHAVTSRLQPSTHDQGYDSDVEDSTHHNSNNKEENQQDGYHFQSQNNNPYLGSRGGQMVHIHPSQTWQLPIRQSSSSHTSLQSSEAITLFHAPTLYENNRNDNDDDKSSTTTRRGPSRWGPDMDIFISDLVQALQVHDNPLVSSLAILYLDRASSVETSRPLGVTPCPYVSPRTVHRLVLVSWILATRAVGRGNANLLSSPQFLALRSSLSLSESDLVQLENDMYLALGDSGLYVTYDELQQFQRNWERTWNRPRLKVSSKKLRRTLVIQTKNVRPWPQQLQKGSLFSSASSFTSYSSPIATNTLDSQTSPYEMYSPNFGQQQPSSMGDSYDMAAVTPTSSTDVAFSLWA